MPKEAIMEIIVEKLNVLLANCYLLMIKTQAAHWNVTGPHFLSLHQLFEEQYNELNPFIDELAERIRALGHMVNATPSQYLSASQVDAQFSHNDWQTMVKELAHDQLTLSQVASELKVAAEESDDDVSADMAIQTMSRHQKAHWMLKSILGE